MITFSFRSLSFNPPLSSPRRLYLCLETNDGASQNSEPFMYSPQTNIASLSEILEFFLKEPQKKGSFQLEIMEFDEMPQRWFRIAKETFALNKLKTNNEPSVLSMPTIYGTTAIVGLRIELAEEIRGSMLEEDMESLLGDTLLPDDASPAVDSEAPKKGSKRQRLQKWLKLDKVEIFKTASMYYDIVYALTPFVEAKQQLIDFFTWKNPQTTWMYSIVLTLIMIYGRYLLAIGLILFAIFGNKAIPYVMKSRPRADKVHGKLRIYKKNFGFVRQLVKDIVFGYDLYRRAADDPNKVVFLLLLHYTKILAPFLALILFIFDLRTLVLAGYWSFLFFNTTKGRELTINMLLQSYHVLVRYKMIPLRAQASLKRLVEYQNLVQETLRKEGVIKDLQKEAAQKEAAIAEIQKEAMQKEAATLQAAAMQIATAVKNEQKETVSKEASVLPAVVMQAATAAVKNEQKETIPEEAAALPAVAMQAAASLTTLLKEPSSRENLLKSPQSQNSTKPSLTSLGELISTPEQNKNKRQIEKTVTIYENQRWWIGIGWTPDLLPGERPSWSDESGKEMHKDKARLPGAGWNWRGDWMYVLSPKTDTQGWEYASRFSKFDDPNRKKSLVHSVRRRTWIRKCVGFDD